MRAKQANTRRRGLAKTINQRYLRYSYEGETIRLPMVTVRLRGGDKSVKTAALVDSGATASFVPPEFVEILGMPLGEASTASGAGGDFRTHLSKITIEVLKGVQVACRIDDEVHVPLEAGRVPYVVLGRDTIFLQYDITFREHREVTILRKPKF